MALVNPLANLLRPKTLSDYAGQCHLLGDAGVLAPLIKNKQLPSMILWGPPGCGKTSLAHVIAEETQIPMHFLSAINSVVKDIKQIGDANQQGLLSESSLVFVDEIHRFNKSQQDALLPYVEAGNIILIGATTENPAFSINKALLSRMRVFTLEKLDEDALLELLLKALNKTGMLPSGVSLNEVMQQASINAMLDVSKGDARRLLTTLEVIIASIQIENPKVNNNDQISAITPELIYKVAGERIANYAKGGDEYYDLLSAFHKSIRGSSVDGGLFWFARLLQVNSDIVPICRRLLAIASEDIGNADPRALEICLNAWDIYHRVGQAEGERAVAQAIVYCALAAKSNAVYNAFKQAVKAAKNYADEPVPLHLRNAPTALAKAAGHGEGYKYAHNFEGAYVPNYDYLPDAVGRPRFYQASDRGLEKQLSAKINYLQERDEWEASQKEGNT